MADERLDFLINVRDQGAASSLRRLADRFAGVNQKMVEHARTAREMAGVTEKLSRLEDRHADALGRVRVAEQNLSEVRSRANAKTSQIVRAEQQLLKARRDAARAAGDVARAVEKAATPDGQKAGVSFTSGFRRWLTGAGGKDMHDAGKFGASVFGSGFLGALKTPVLGPALVAAILAVAGTVLPAAGAVAGGAVVAGFGAGLAGLGLVFAAKSQRVRDAWKSTLAGMAADLRILSKPLENVLIAWTIVAKRTFAALKPTLAGVFATLTPALAGFGDQLGRAFEKLGPALKPVSEAFAAVLRSLGPAMQSALGSIAAGMLRLSQSIRANPTALAEFVKGVGTITGDLLNLLAVFNDADRSFKVWTGGMSLVTAVMGAFRLALGLLVGPMVLVIKGAERIAAAMNWLADKLGIGTRVTFDAAGAQDTFSAKLLTTAASIRQTVKPVETLAQKYNRQKAATDQLIESTHRLSGQALTLRGAQTSMAQAVADATSAIAANGRTLSLATQKGRDNRAALDQVARAANDQHDAMIRAGKGTDAANAASVRGRAQFVRLATQMGLSKTQAQRLAAQLIDTQKKIDALHGKTVLVKYTTGGFNLLDSSVGRRSQKGGAFATGGPVRGPGGGTSDRAGLFALSNNEFVVKAASAQKYGNKAMSSVNDGTARIIPGMAAGGPVVNFHTQGVFKSLAQARSVLMGLGASSTPGGGAGVQRWRGVALAALAAAHEPPSWIGSLLSRMQRESGGNPRAINLWDSNAKRGTPSIGLMQTIGPTFAAYAGKYRSRGIYDPFANIFAAIRYTVARYGSGPAGWNRPGGYKNGGWLMPGQLAYNETRRPEAVFNQHQLAGMARTEIVLRVESGGAAMDQLIAQILRKYVRVHGGNVQQVLGQRGP